MLYISRFVGANKYGVIDTDDGVETVVGYRDIMNIAQLGLEIKGVSVEPSLVGKKRSNPVMSIQVYSNPSMSTVKLTKMKVLSGVDISVADGVISSVAWSRDSLAKSKQIRLSDYGSSCADNIFGRGYGESSNNPLTVILDDKITVSEHSFDRFPMYSVIMDIREVTNKKTVKAVYNGWTPAWRFMSLSKSVIDDSARLEFHEADFVITSGTNTSSKRFHPEIQVKIEKKYAEEFIRLSYSRFQFVSTSMSIEVARSYVWGMRTNVYFWRDRCQDYDKVRLMDCNLFNILVQTTTCNAGAVARFCSYLANFDPTPELKEAYVRLCNNANNWYLDLGEQKGWLM